MHDDWFSEFEPSVAFWLRSRMHSYLVLRAFKDSKLIPHGLARTKKVSADRSQYKNYFQTPREFDRWLRVIAYRETLRLLPYLKPIEDILKEMPPASTRVLRWSYDDQFTEHDVARMLCLRTKTR